MMMVVQIRTMIQYNSRDNPDGKAMNLTLAKRMIDHSTDEEDTSPDSAMQSHDSHQMKWSSGAGKSLRAYGSGSRTTEYRQKQRQATLQQEAASCYSIKALFKRQQDLKLSVKETPTSEAPEVSSLKDVERGKPRDPAAKAIARRDASKDFKRLIEFPSEHVLSQKSEFSFLQV